MLRVLKFFPFALMVLCPPTWAQGLNQLACKIVIERDGDDVRAFAVAQALLRSKAKYTFKASKISPSGLGASEQKGEEELLPQEVTVLSQVRFRLEANGWVDFELNVIEQLTGATCTAKETVS